MIMHTTLDHLQPNQTGTIAIIDAGAELTGRMCALGLRLGRIVEVVRIAPMRGPLQIRVGHTELMIRRADAAKINVTLNPS
jgi:ferrous iron transport protein A